MRYSFVCILLLGFWSCKTENSLEREISNIDIDLNIERFDLAFSGTNNSNFPKLKSTYPFLFSDEISDSLWLAKKNDSLQQELHAQVKMQFEELFDLEDDIKSLFQHLKYYDKTFSMPRVITVTSNVDYRNKVIVTDTIVLIALDTYLGSDHEFYSNFQRYIKQNFTRNQIVVDLATEYAQKQLLPLGRSNLLQQMIQSGKILYFKDVMIPFKGDAEKIGYTDDQLAWAQANESSIWSYFIERELLYETDPNLVVRFINDAPFTKFGLELDNESPGRLGQYLGWQIVRSYMEKNDVSYKEMFSKSADDIFNNSGFKPRK